MTNGDVIRRKLSEMSDDELSVCVADFVMDNINSSEWYALDGKFPRERVLTWLGMESKEEDPDSANNEALHTAFVRHGRWLNARISGDDFKKCSECECYIENTFFANDYDVRYCPSCGAKMDEV